MRKILFSIFILMFLIIIPKVNASTYGWGFKRNNDHKTPEIGKYAAEIKDTNSY